MDVIMTITFEKAVSIADKHDEFITNLFENLTPEQEESVIQDLNALFNENFTGYLADLLVELSEEDIFPYDEAISYYFPKETYEFLCSIIEKDAVDRYLNFGELPSMLSIVANMEMIVDCEGNFDFEDEVK